MKTISSYGNHKSQETAKAISEAILRGDIESTTAWEATTNIKQCGGMDGPCRAIIHRALRKAGISFFLATFCGEGEEQSFHHWGLATKAKLEEIRREPRLVNCVVGYSLHHTAHKMGNGNAVRGWEIFHSF